MRFASVYLDFETDTFHCTRVFLVSLTCSLSLLDLVRLHAGSTREVGESFCEHKQVFSWPLSVA